MYSKVHWRKESCKITTLEQLEHYNKSLRATVQNRYLETIDNSHLCSVAPSGSRWTVRRNLKTKIWLRISQQIEENTKYA